MQRDELHAELCRWVALQALALEAVETARAMPRPDACIRPAGSCPHSRSVVCVWRCYYADAKGKFDEVVEAKGVRILIEPAALMHVLGTKMDFLEDKLK